MRVKGIVASFGIAAVLLASALPVAAVDISEVSGIVQDTDGNPVAGAEVTFTNTTNSALEFSVKTNKKGRYFIPNLLYNEPGEWDVIIVAEGYIPTNIAVESRKSDRTLVGEYETKIRAGTPHKVLIKAFGEARVDFTMMTEAKRAEIERQRQEEALAKAQAEAAETIDPMQLASKMVADGDLEGSLEELERAIEANPDDPERRELLAKVLYNLERYDDALGVAGELQQMAPDYAGIHLLLADIHAKSGDYDLAREELAAQAEVSPDDITVYRRMAWIAEQEGDTAASIEANEAIVRIEPGNTEAWLALGGLYAEAGQTEKSQEAFTRVAEIDPDNAYETFFNIGVLIENKPDPTPAEEKRALEAFRKSVEIKPDFAKGHLRLAYAQLRSGDLPGARGSFERYLELAPDAPDSGEVRSMVSALPQ
jgi:tetratricopeptide (TPR) repeat protein